MFETKLESVRTDTFFVVLISISNKMMLEITEFKEKKVCLVNFVRIPHTHT